MRTSKDHRSVGLQWLLPLSDADPGDHGRPLGLFRSCFIFSINLGFSWLLPQTVFCEGICRGPVDNMKDRPSPSSFLSSLVLPQTIFPGGISHICWLMRKPFTMIMKFWKSALCLGNIPLQRLELRAKRGGKRGLHVGAIFPSPFKLF
jgi:hypothetical protein